MRKVQAQDIKPGMVGSHGEAVVKVVLTPFDAEITWSDDVVDEVYATTDIWIED